MILTQENYHSQEANLHYMSVSQYKDFLKCEAAAVAKLNGKYTDLNNESLMIGSYVHAAIEGPEAVELFKETHPGMYSSRGTTKGELKADYKQADEMIKAILNDPLCVQMLQGEREVIITAELFGVMWKSKLDAYAPEEGRFSDLKTVKSIREKYWQDGRYMSFVEAYKYTTQLAVYAELERLHSERFDYLEPLIVAVSKEDEPDLAVICFDERMIEEELAKVQLHIQRVIDVKQGFEDPKRCESCRYCRKTKKAGIVHYLNLLEVV